MNNNRKVYFNDKFVDEKDARLSIYDSALMFGDMVFEMTRSFNKKQFMLKEHIKRLFYGIKILRIPLNKNEKEIEKACYETMEQNSNAFNDDDEHRLMIDVSRGILGIYHGIQDINKGPNLIIADFPLKWTVAGMGKLYDEGINAVITSQRVIPAHLMDPKIKNRSRLFYLNANIEASQIKGKNNWALMLDTDGFIAEGSGDNFFIVKNKEVISPEGRNILRGISRDYVKELCEELNLTYKEKNIDQYDVYTSDEAFMSGTPFCILPVTRLNDINIGNGKPGEIYSLLLKKWSENVKLDIAQQVKKWDKENKNNIVKSDAPRPYEFK